jgi:ATP-binding cassette, subfamily B, bacterial MsbA
VNAFQRLLRYARPYRKRLVWAIVAMVVYAAASAYLAWLVKPIFDQVLPNRVLLRYTSIAILSAYFLKGVGSYFSDYWMADVGQRVVMDIRNRLYRHILDQSVAFFGRHSVGQLLSRVTNDVSQVQRAVSETIADLLRESLAIVGYTGLLFYYDARLALVCVTGAPLVIYPLVRLGRRVRRMSRRSQEQLERISHVGAEAFNAHRIVKAFGAEGREGEKFSRELWHLFRTNMKVTSIMSVMPPVMELVGAFGMVGALWYGSRQIATARLTPGEFTSFLAALLLMYGPIKKLSRVNANLQQAVAASERIFEVLDVRSEVPEKADAVPLPPFCESIVFQNVTFGYDDGRPRPILKGISLNVHAGEMVAIVGRSGAGKTSLVNLLPRFFDVTGGAIRIDDHDLRDVTLASLRAQIGIVTQETVLFDDSIASNIAYGEVRSTKDEIEAAASAAHAHEFITALPQGYQTFIGERGQRLSGGQRQRLAIARALLKNAPILILDEATSSLDTEAERLVQDALATLMMNRTSFVIAHRLSTIRRADAIVVLDKGRIAEIGRHDDLLARGGTYAKLYAMQLLEPRTIEEGELKGEAVQRRGV